MNLDAHILNADFSINLPTDIVHFEWEWDTNHLFEGANELIEQIMESGNETPTLKDLTELKIQTPKTKWTALKVFISFICSLTALAIIAIIIIILILHPKLLNASFINLLNRKTKLVEPLTQTSGPEIELHSLYPNCPANMTPTVTPTRAI